LVLSLRLVLHVLSCPVWEYGCVFYSLQLPLVLALVVAVFDKRLASGKKDTATSRGQLTAKLGTSFAFRFYGAIPA